MDTPTTLRNRFGARLYDKLAAARPGENLFLSPFSVQVALAMCAAGARGETRRVLADLIGAPKSVEQQNREYAKLLTSIHGEGDRPFELITANALWGQQGYRFNPGYRRDVADFYGGVFQEVNFVSLPDEAMKTINTWVSDKTRDKIKELIRRDFITADTRLILTNAIYFKGQWEDEFDEADTSDEDWHSPEGREQVPMMHRRGGYLYYEGDGFQALDLPHKGRELSLLVVLPTKKDGLPALERTWATGATYYQVTEGLYDEAEVIVSLPRFRVEAEFKLKPALEALGAGLAFTDEADFGGIGDTPLRISEVVHKAFAEVNEEGTEAAAATAVGMALCSAVIEPQEPKVFKADHPFLFFIRDRQTNAVLFSGRVLEPK